MLKNKYAYKKERIYRVYTVRDCQGEECQFLVGQGEECQFLLGQGEEGQFLLGQGMSGGRVSVSLGSGIVRESQGHLQWSGGK